MPYLIDGHNLIPLLGLRLSDPEDEAKLTLLLQRYFARTGRQGTVYFDRMAPGGAKGTSSRHLAVRFIAPPRTADDAIRAHLSRLHREARNWTVVSNDQAIRHAAERAGARWVSAAEFAAEVRSARQGGTDEKPEASLSPDELSEFERLFQDGKQGKPSS
jgi:predicted RNA-binding protein with PIN domain